jgi:hypothetical protein
MLQFLIFFFGLKLLKELNMCEISEDNKCDNLRPKTRRMCQSLTAFFKSHVTDKSAGVNHINKIQPWTTLTLQHLLEPFVQYLALLPDFTRQVNTMQLL